MRTHFDNQLEQLHVELIKMGALCEEGISFATKCMFTDNKDLLNHVFEIEEQIDQSEKTIESLCMRLLLQQQPVARDLRTISSALKMISDMERIGDQASDIAEIVKYLPYNDTDSKLHIKDMATATIKMVTDSIESFVNKDIDMAKSVILYDDKVDDLFDKVKKELTELIRENLLNPQTCLDLLMIAKYFERIGDHATNIAEWVCYSISGIHKNSD